MRALIVSFATLLNACPALAPGPAPKAHISETVTLSLPVPPGYPETRTIQHAIHARYADRDAAIDAILSLSPERVDIVITAAGGPRLATIRWDEDGLHHERTLLAPVGIPVENITADIFVAMWPIAAVQKALRTEPDCVATASADGARKIECGGKTIMAIEPDPARPGAIVVRNLAFGYEMTIVSRVLD